MQPQVKIPIFPLEVVLLPGMILPLHIFEERYKIMIGECLAVYSEFGVVCCESSEMKNKGCSARIERVLKRYDDGRMDIATRGVRRFMIHSTSDDRPYLQAVVTYFDDAVEDDTEEIGELIEEGVKLLGQLNSMAGTRQDYTPLFELDRKAISFWISNSTGFTLDDKQQYLEMTSTSGRIRKSVNSLKKIVARMKVAQQVERIIRGNGSLRQLKP
jgi:Lon protease-like protein